MAKPNMTSHEWVNQKFPKRFKISIYIYIYLNYRQKIPTQLPKEYVDPHMMWNDSHGSDSIIDMAKNTIITA